MISYRLLAACAAGILAASPVQADATATGAHVVSAVKPEGVAQALSDSDWRIARALGPQLAARGLLLVGLDVIGDKVTEINVTSPTCFQEIQQQTGCDVAALYVAALECAVAQEGA